MLTKLPLISVILNVFNEKENIQRCLRIIREQNYPQNKIEIILVDDKSTDNTVELAKKFHVRVVTSGYKNRERAKSIGIQYAKGKFLLLMDADVFLGSKNWIKDAVTYLEINKNASAVQSIRWIYKKNDTLVNRYCNLFGINDPLVFFLGKRGALMATEKEWMYKETVKKKISNAYLVKFTVDNLPTVGAQGYIVRTSYIKKTSWRPYFFHLDTAYEMVMQGNNTFIMAFLPVEHLYSGSVREFYLKLYRNITLFLLLKKHRKYTYKVNTFRFLLAILTMLTIIIPCYQSIKGYNKIQDPAWFLHILFSVTVQILYFFVVIKAFIQNHIKYIL